MSREDVLAVLREHRQALKARAVSRAALFGSLARGDGRAGSDVDVLIEFDPQARITVYHYAAVKRFIAELLGGPVDVIDQANLNRHLRGEIERDAVYAF